MDFDFTEDQQSLRDAVARWVDKAYSFERRREIVATGGFDRATYGELAELGLTALTVPEDNGGMGLGAVDAMIVMEELGRGIVLEPLTQTLIASGDDALVRGDGVAAACLAGLGFADIQTVARLAFLLCEHDQGFAAGRKSAWAYKASALVGVLGNVHGPVPR